MYRNWLWRAGITCHHSGSALLKCSVWAESWVGFCSEGRVHGGRCAVTLHQLHAATVILMGARSCLPPPEEDQAVSLPWEEITLFKLLILAQSFPNGFTGITYFSVCWPKLGGKHRMSKSCLPLDPISMIPGLSAAVLVPQVLGKGGAETRGWWLAQRLRVTCSNLQYRCHPKVGCWQIMCRVGTWSNLHLKLRFFFSCNYQLP